MKNDTRSLVKYFEDELDNALFALPSISCNPFEVVNEAAFLIEQSVKFKRIAGTNQISNGLKIITPYIIGKPDVRARVPEPEQLLEDLIFSGHYYLIREYLYYTYNFEGSFGWKFKESGLEIRFQERTIPRQFFMRHNTSIMGSYEVFKNFKGGKRIIRMLRGAEEFAISKDISKSFELIETEVEIKLNNYYNFIDPTDQTDFGEYTYSQFYQVYKALVAKALYHRYWSTANNRWGPVRIQIDQIVNGINAETGIPTKACKAILMDISYSLDKKRKKIQPMYFSLYYFDSRKSLIMIPTDFCVHEGLINFLRVKALANPQFFLENLSQKLGDNFVDYVTNMFISQGFRCLRNVSLNQFNLGLPDIDLLVISEEKTLGYVVYCCELKNPIPANWSKDYLRGLEGDGISKAFKQMKKLNEFLVTDQGIGFIRSLLPAEGLPHFGEDFLLLLNFLVITSYNSGIFFGNEKYGIIDYQTLHLILEKCDGDIYYVMRCLREFNQWADECIEIVPQEFYVGNKKVTYDGVSIKKPMGFLQNKYKSAKLDSQFAKIFIKEGRSPLDYVNLSPFSHSND